MARASSDESQPRDDCDLLAHLRGVGEERLAEPAFVVRDQARGGGEDVAGRAVVPLQPDHGRAGKIALEAQDVVHLGAAPAIDRLVVVADAADVLVLLREQPQPEILRDVGVLVFVDQHVAEAALVIGEHIGPLAEEPQAFEQQVAEIGGVQRLQPLLVFLVELAPPCRWRRNKPRRSAPCPASARGSSSRRWRRRAGAPASASRRCWRRR